jgi:hypothetical protein
MQRITITIDQVFDVTTGNSRYKQACTFFSFRSVDASQFGVAAPGEPEIRNGMTVSVLLEKRDNWQTLLGWVNHGNREIVCWSRGYHLFFMLWSIPVGFALLVLSQQSPTVGIVCLIALAFYFFLHAREYYFLSKVRQALKNIKNEKYSR